MIIPLDREELKQSIEKLENDILNNEMTDCKISETKELINNFKKELGI